MMTIDEMKKRKKALGLTNQQLAEKSGVPLATVAKVLSKTTKSPRINTLLALEKVLTDDSAQPDNDSRSLSIAGQYPANIERADNPAQEPSGDYLYGSNVKNYSGSLQEISASDESADSPGNSDADFHDNSGVHNYVIYSQDGIMEVEKSPENSSFKQPFHTVEEYLALPDERRVELIDGHFYDLASPNGIHQQITFMLWRAFFECIEAHKMPCKVQGAPFDVRLDAYTVVQPDVMVFCEDPSQVFAVRATTPPDLVIEILSKSTAFKDRHLKLFKYRNAGVREVWLVSPEHSTVEVYLFAKEDDLRTYSFDDKIPVRISRGKCIIDFAEIKKRLPAL